MERCCSTGQGPQRAVTPTEEEAEEEEEEEEELFAALSFKLEGGGFDSQWRHWDFSLI